MKVTWVGGTDKKRSMILSLRTLSLDGMKEMCSRTALPGRDASGVDRGPHSVMIPLTGANLQVYSLIRKTPERKE
jgi:hypothetical protein